MPWDKRGYYYRKKRIGRRVVSEYVGKGPGAALLASCDENERAGRLQERKAFQAMKREHDTLEENAAAFDAITTALMKQELEAAGYHQHARGQWRKRRGN